MPGIDRVEIEVGRLDPRLKLAPCQRVEPYLPTGTRLWGKARIGLRCTLGPDRLECLPADHGQGLCAGLGRGGCRWRPGSTVGAGDLVQSEVDLADNTAALITDPEQAIGRSLVRAIAPGSGVRAADLRPRQWFSAGDAVKIVAQGRGFSISGSGEAHGARRSKDGWCGCAPTGGRIVSGIAAGDRRVEIRP